MKRLCQNQQSVTVPGAWSGPHSPMSLPGLCGGASQHASPPPVTPQDPRPALQLSLCDSSTACPPPCPPFCLCGQVPWQQHLTWTLWVLRGPNDGPQETLHAGATATLLPLSQVPLIHSFYPSPTEHPCPLTLCDITSVQNPSKCLHHVISGLLQQAKQPLDTPS